MRVIITGATGFVGRNLIGYLNTKQVILQGLSLRNENWKKIIIHLAGKAHDTSNTSSDALYYKINRDLTIELFKEFLDSDIKDFFFFSSVKAVADTVDGVLDEERQAIPKTPYGRSKYEAEEYLLSQELPKGKRLFIIRPCMIHGPGNKGNLNLLYKIVRKGIPWPLAAFENHRSFLSISNLCYLVEVMIKDKQVISGIYNFADDRALSTNELVTLIAEATNSKPKLLYFSKSMMSKVARIGDKLRLPLNSERLKKLTENYVVSNQKIKTALNIDSLPIDAYEGLTKTIKSFEDIEVKIKK